MTVPWYTGQDLCGYRLYFSTRYGALSSNKQRIIGEGGCPVPTNQEVEKIVEELCGSVTSLFPQTKELLNNNLNVWFRHDDSEVK